MTRHAELIELSSYLDGELSGERRHELETHVRRCASCRRQLAGLERTVARLREVGRESPPGRLASQIHRQLVAEHRRPGRLQTIERWLSEWRPAPALIAGAALIVALAAILQIFVTGGALMQQREAVTDAPRPQEPEAAGAAPARVRVLREEEATSIAEGKPDSMKVLVLGERRFRVHRGAWVEEGVTDREPERSLSWAQARAEGIVAAVPGLEALEVGLRPADRPRPVVLRFQDEVVRITAPQPQPE